MQAKKPTTLTVVVSGKNLIIEVPSVKAEDLLRFLRSRRVTASPPFPCSTGIDSIVLGKGTKAETVQALLDQWG